MAAETIKISEMATRSDFADTDIIPLVSNPAGSPASHAAALGALANYFNEKQFVLLSWRCTGDGTESDTLGLNQAVAAAQLTGQDILVTPGTYLVDGNTSVPEGVNLVFAGGIIKVTGNLTINGGVSSLLLHRQCFEVASAATAADSLLKIRDTSDSTTVSPHVEKFSPIWFDGSDIGEKINKCWQVGGTKTLCTVPTGFHALTTRVDMDSAKWGSHLTLEGVSFIATTLQMVAGSAMTGVDASTSDECDIRNIRVTEATGSRSCICFAGGGTSLKVRQCWAGNADYGFYQNKGSGTQYENNYAENCEWCAFFASNHDARGAISDAPEPTAGITSLVWRGGELHSAATHNMYIGREGTNIINTMNIVGAVMQSAARQNIYISDNHTAQGIKALSITGCGIREAAGGGTDDCGIYVNNASVTLNGNTITDNIDAGVGLEGSAIVMATGTIWGDATGTEQLQRWKIIGTATGNPQYSDLNSYTLKDDTVVPNTYTTDFVSGTLNSSNEDVITNRAIGDDEIHIWDVFGEAANGDLDQVYKLWVYCDNSADITSHEHRYLENGSQTVTVADNTDNTYTINIANGNTNNKIYFGSLREVVRRAT